MLKIYNPEEIKKECRVKLTETKDKIYLNVVGKNGVGLAGGTLISLDKETGRIHRFGYIDKTLGLDLDELRKLKTD